MIALCRCPHGLFSWGLYVLARRAFDDGARRGPLASIAGVLFPALRQPGQRERGERVMIVPGGLPRLVPVLPPR